MNRLLLLLFCLFSLLVHTQELPPVVNHPPGMYGADDQNWMISQSKENYIYVANNRGLLEYNGAKWNLYPSPNETIMRSVKCIDDRIYSGSYMDFGYWVRNEKGVLIYTSLKKKLNVKMIEDEQVWNIIAHENWILFQSLNRIYLYNGQNERISSIEANNITKLFKLEDELFFQVMNEGLYTIENSAKKLVNDHPILRENRLVDLFIRNDQKTFLTEQQGFYSFGENTIEKWEVAADSLLKELSIYSSIRRKDNSFFLGTISNGIVHLSAQGAPVFTMDQTNGLSDNTALSLFEDSEGNVWLGLDNGIDCINAQVPFKNYIDQQGKLGSIYASVVHQGGIYLGTNQGLFYKPNTPDSDFAFVEGTQGQVWFLDVIDGQLFCGHNVGTFLVNGTQVDKIADVQGTWSVKKIPNKEGLLIQGNYNGLNILTNESGRWAFKNKLSGFNISSKHFELAKNNTILVSHEYKGVFSLDVNTSFTKIERFSEVNSVEKGAHSSLASFYGDIFYAYRKGVFKYHPKDGTFTRDSILSNVFSNDEFISGKLIADHQNRLWVFTKNYVSYVTREKLSSSFKVNKISIPQSLRNGKKGYENVSHLNDKTYLLGASSGYIVMDLLSSNSKQYNVAINSITYNKLNGEKIQVARNTPGVFDANQNYIALSYSIPEFDKYLVAEYQYQLKGQQDQWSSWSTDSQKSFENLPFGEYEFNVRARVSNQESVNTATYEFTINRPWYLSNLAITIYALVLILLFIAVNGAYRRYYKKQRERLLEKSTRELALKELEAQKEIVELKNNNLHQDIEARNRELAVSTMNMIKTNNILNDIKSELVNIKDVSEMKSVVTLIDKNLSNDEDWKFFEEAFNHADKGFFKKVKELHPELTSNDLRLCVYLRLNLSSKEIAPLLNISPRSVEIKRYRLRKKINLPRENNLNEYFISL